MNRNNIRWNKLKGKKVAVAKKEYRPMEIIPKLREAAVLMSQGMTQDLAAKQSGESTQTLIR